MKTYGRKFKVELFGSSHSPRLGVVIGGIPSGFDLEQVDFMKDILRRKSGPFGTTARIESDEPGIEDRRKTDGTVVISFDNRDVRPQDYESFRTSPRPGHADLVASQKYGDKVPGWFSGRMTLPLVAAGAIAKALIAPLEINAALVEVGGVSAADEMAVADALEKVSGEGDSLGGIVECVCSNIPAGIGEPFFDSLESLLSHAMFSIPGIRGIEFGDGFASARMKGSQHNDPIIDSEGHTSKNGCGGINGGISNGNPIIFRVAVKPTSSISREQISYNFESGRIGPLSVKGRHDVCFALRVPPVVEAMAAIVLADSLEF